MLTRQWARSVCDNYRAAVRQSLPARIELVDLSRLKMEEGEPRIPRCARNSALRRAVPAGREEIALVCAAEFYGGKPDQDHVAVLRIDGDLGAAWFVWSGNQSRETAEAMAARQGQAIVALVRHGLGPREDFSTLHRTLCGLGRAQSRPGPGADCGQAAPANRAQNPCIGASRASSCAFCSSSQADGLQRGRLLKYSHRKPERNSSQAR
jgi:hypothetical protein